MLFTIQLIFSFIIGGLFIAMQTLFAERVSPMWRGIILTIPSTMAMGLLFIGLAKSPGDAAEATLMIPAVEGLAYAYFTVFALLASKHISLGLIGALISWFAIGFAFIYYPPQTFLISIFYGLPLTIISYLITIKLPHTQYLKAFPINTKTITTRAILGGAIIVLAVFLSKTLGNYWGGLFATFPAVFTSTLIIYYYLQGPKSLPSVGRTLFLPGAIGFLIYGYMVKISFPEYGIWIGTLLAYIVTLAFYYAWAKIFKKT